MTSDTLEARRTGRTYAFPMSRIVIFVIAVAILALVPAGATALHMPSVTGFATQVLIYSIAAMRSEERRVGKEC